MIISVNWLKKFTDIELPIDQLATLIGARLVEIEQTIDQTEKYKDVIVAKVVSCVPLEGSDHLNVARLDDGKVITHVDRDESGHVQVVCGAPNVREGLMVAWLPPAAVVPETFGTAEPFTLGARKLRGVMSNGMIASARELDLFDEHDGILEVSSECTPGDRFASVYELDDQLLDIENKSLTHRPDTFGIIGFAREVAAIQGKKFVTPQWLTTTDPVYDTIHSEVAAPTVTIDDPTVSARYMATVLKGADSTRQSPFSIQTYLARVGVRPINAVVDVTNYLMMLTGQPLHAFDYDKVVALTGGSPDIHVRRARSGETLDLLDGRTISLATNDVVVAAGDTVVALAGAMGGANTMIDESTKNIIIEAATFDLYSLRGTQMRHGMFSEAVTRFTKGQPPELAAPVLAEAIRLMTEWSGARRVSDVVEAYPGKRQPSTIAVSVGAINGVLGTHYDAQKIVDTLRNVECSVDIAPADDTVLNITPPYWRGDIHIAEDIIEEIGRINSYDAITPQLPARDFTAVAKADIDELRTQIRKLLVRGGANEVLTYSFVHGDVMRKAGQNPEEAYRITNSISPELQYYRQSLTPSLLGLVHANIKNGYDNFSLFELNKVHSKVLPLTHEDVPQEAHQLGVVFASKKLETGAAYYQVKRILDYMMSVMNITLTYTPLVVAGAIDAPYEARRSARIVDAKTGIQLGVVGEYTKHVARNFKLPAYAAGLELDIEALLDATRQNDSVYTPLSRFPGTERDMCFRVPAHMTYSTLADFASVVLKASDFLTELSPVDIFQSATDATVKNVTVRIKLTARDHTITKDEAAAVVADVQTKVLAAIPQVEVVE